MEMFAVIETKGNDMELLLVTDTEERAYKRLAEAKQKCLLTPSVRHAVLSTKSFELSSGGAADISSTYEWECLEAVVRDRLSEKGADKERFPGEFGDLVSSVTCSAFDDIQRYGVPEDCAISDAMEEYASEIESIMKDEM